MFISNEDKDFLFKSIDKLEERINVLNEKIDTIKNRLDIHDKVNVNMTNRMLKLEGIDLQYQHGNTITVSSTDVKWGTKKDGTPRRKPGRKPAREVFNKGAKK